MRSWDNLKKVLISATPFPGMSGLESAWREAAELAADDAAVANRQDALNLAAALIKLSRSSKQWSEPALASGLVSGSCSIRLRVGRLLEWRAADRAGLSGRGPDPCDAIQRLALQSLSTEDLTVLADVIEPGRRECEWTESESTAVRALTGAFEQEVRRAGYRSMAEFQRHGFGPASMS